MIGVGLIDEFGFDHCGFDISQGVLHICVPLVGLFVVGDLYFVMRVKLGLRVRAAQSAVALLLLVGLPLCVMFPMMHNARLLRLHTGARRFAHLCIWAGPASFVLWEVGATARPASRFRPGFVYI